MPLASDREILPSFFAAKKNNSADALMTFVTSERRSLKCALSEVGIILIRGFDVGSISVFEDAVKLFSESKLFDYAGGASPRARLGGHVYNSTEYPPSLPLTLHNELSYSKVFPRYIYFFCCLPPSQGGETTFGDSRTILANLPDEIVRNFRDRGVCYERNLTSDESSAYSWQAAFETCDKADVDHVCHDLGIDLTWKTDGGVRLIQNGPATIRHPETHEAVWFNQAEGFHPSSLDAESLKYFVDNKLDFRLRASFGDGTEIPESYLSHIREAISDLTQLHQWRTGDILILDNVLTAHGRRPFSGRRQIAVTTT